MKLNLTTPQLFGIALVILGVLGASTAQLTDLFGPQVTKYIVSASSLLSTIAGGILAFISGQGSQVQSVLAMPGVESIQVNKQANQTLAAMAVDPTLDKIEAAPGASQAVEAAAKGA